MNLDGSDAASAFALPRIELHSGAHGWTAVCHLEGGTSKALTLGPAGSVAEAKRAAVQAALSALGERWEPALRALL